MADFADWPIVMFGAPRSGTTYLNTMLNTHPEVYVTHETRVFSWLHTAAREISMADRAVKNLRHQFIAHLDHELPAVVQRFYQGMRFRARYWGDKNPFYAATGGLGVLDTVAELFPGARFVHIIRDGRDVVASLLRKVDPSGAPWVSFAAAGRIWTEHVDNGVAFGATRSAQDYLELRFEELIADDLAAARRLFGFLDIPIAPETIEFCQQQQEARTPVSGATTIGDIGTPQWMLALSVEEQLALLRSIGPHLVRYGYETDASLLELQIATADLA